MSITFWCPEAPRWVNLCGPRTIPRARKSARRFRDGRDARPQTAPKLSAGRHRVGPRRCADRAGSRPAPRARDRSARRRLRDPLGLNTGAVRGFGPQSGDGGNRSARHARRRAAAVLANGGPQGMSGRERVFGRPKHSGVDGPLTALVEKFGSRTLGLREERWSEERSTLPGRAGREIRQAGPRLSAGRPKGLRRGLGQDRLAPADGPQSASNWATFSKHGRSP
jgi:hypothetical protein